MKVEAVKEDPKGDYKEGKRGEALFTQVWEPGRLMSSLELSVEACYYLLEFGYNNRGNLYKMVYERLGAKRVGGSF